MKRRSLLLILILFLLAPAADAAGRVRTAATLLELFRKSDTILIGRFDKRVDGETSRVGDGYSVVNISDHYDITSALKGETRRFLVLDDEEYRYQIPPSADGEAPRQAVFIEDIENYDPETRPVPGDTVMLFLKRSGRTLELADYRDGVRKVPAGQLMIYIDRINELNSIFGSKRIDVAAITEWLVRCAEEPATRWDGAYELLDGFRRLNGSQGKTGETGQRTAYDRAEFARALTERQKAELASILIYRKGTEPTFLRGDRELIELVRRWGGPVYAAFILDRIAYGEMAAADNSFLMNTLSQLIDDRQVTDIAGAYTKLAFSVAELNGPVPAQDIQRNKLLRRFVTRCQRILSERSM